MLKLKKNEPRPKFTGSDKKEACSCYRGWQEKKNLYNKYNFLKTKSYMCDQGSTCIQVL